MKRIPVNLISGPLGVGKTTAIRHLLDNRPAGERWAVLVNEFGMVGLDAALLADVAEPKGIDVREVAGGCICCSASFLFEISLAMLLAKAPDRLLIEPTGLAALSGILDTLDGEPVRDRIDVRSTICLLDPATAELDRQREEVADQIEAADVLLASRSDLSTAAQREAFSAWAQALFPQKAHVDAIEHGRIDGALLDLVADRQDAAPRAGYQHSTDHHHAGVDETRQTSPADETPEWDAAQSLVRRDHLSPATSTVGWAGWNGLVFNADQVVDFLGTLTTQLDAQRTKAVLRTDDGWLSFNFTQDLREARPTAYRRDSRIEVIVQGKPAADLDALDAMLRACLMHEAAAVAKPA
ncbi:MAG: GTP-binding protein [Acidobacteriota bacterium]